MLPVAHRSVQELPHCSPLALTAQLLQQTWFGPREKGGWLLLVSLEKVVIPSHRMSHQFPGALSQLPGDQNQLALSGNHSSPSFPAEIPGAQRGSGDGPAPLQTDCLWEVLINGQGKAGGNHFLCWSVRTAQPRDGRVAEPSRTCGHVGCAWIWDWCAHTNPTGTGQGHLCPGSQPVPWGAASKLCIPTDCSWSPEGLSPALQRPECPQISLQQ